MKTVKHLFILIFIVTFTMVGTGTALAQADGSDGGNLGLGVILGEPTGISLKSWNNARSALDLGVAWSFEGNSDAIHVHGDYLLHNWFDNVESGRLAFYYGIGGRVILSDNSQAGVRVPFGLNYLLEGAPVGLFIEVVPVLNLTPNTDFDGQGGLGLRYYF